MKNCLRVNPKFAGYGTMTLANNYFIKVEQYVEGEEYDICFSIYDPCENVKAKHIVLMCADQNLKTYMNYTHQIAEYANNFTEILVVRNIPEVVNEIKKDFPNCRIKTGNFILFDFDDKYTTENKQNAILHLGRLCDFKNSLDLIRNPDNYLSKYGIYCYGNNFTTMSGELTAKGQKFESELHNNQYFAFVDDKNFPSDINIMGQYNQTEVYDFASKYKYSIAFYNEKFLENVEYAMLEMINAGTYIILNEDYVKTFEKLSILGKFPENCYICRKSNETIDEVIEKANLLPISECKQKWKEFYNSDKIYNDILNFILN